MGVRSFLEAFGARAPVQGLAALVSPLVPLGMGLPLRRAATNLLRPQALALARRHLGRGEVDLHLGCGPRRLEGWLNVDVVGTGADLCLDLTAPLPFPDRSVRAVFTEHTVEHLAAPAAVGLLKEAHRVLRPGGVLRVVVPDFRLFASSYLGDGELLRRLHPDAPTPLLAVMRITHDYGHRSIWDGATLCRLLQELGFVAVEERGFGESRLRPAPDAPARQPESVYVEALAP